MLENKIIIIEETYKFPKKDEIKYIGAWSRKIGRKVTVNEGKIIDDGIDDNISKEEWNSQLKNILDNSIKNYVADNFDFKFKLIFSSCVDKYPNSYPGLSGYRPLNCEVHMDLYAPEEQFILFKGDYVKFFEEKKITYEYVGTFKILDAHYGCPCSPDLEY